MKLHLRGLAIVAVCVAFAPLGCVARAEDKPPDSPPPAEIAPTTDSTDCPDARADDRRLTLSWTDGLVAESADQAFRVHIGGRFDFDSGWYSAPTSLQQSLANPLLDGTDFRRFRLGADGTVYDQVQFAIEADFSKASDIKGPTTSPQTNIFITNAYIAVPDLPVVDTVRVGHQKEYLTFSNATSSSFLPFMERPYIYDAFENDFAYDSGIATYRTYFDQSVTSWVGVFWNGTESQAFNVAGGAAVSGRLTWMPIYDEPGQRWLNFCVSGSLRSIRDNPEEVTVRPLVRTGQASQTPNLIDTGTIDGENGLQLLGGGVHGAWGPWTFGGEFLGLFIPDGFLGGLPNPNGTLPPGVQAVGDLFFWGAYVEVLYFLTPGDHQPVNRTIPGYTRVRPVRNFLCNGKGEHGWGAWDVGLRYDYVNVNSGPVQAGQLNSLTAGLNWYLNGNARVTLNYVYTFRDIGDAPGTGSFSALGARVHFDF